MPIALGRLRLKPYDKKKLKQLRRGNTPARVSNRAHILLELSKGHHVDDVSDTVGVSTSTVKRVRRRYLDEGLQGATEDKVRPGRPKELTDFQRNRIIATACSKAPDSRARWTIRLLVEKTGHSFGVVQSVLSSHGIKPWLQKNVVRSND